MRIITAVFAFASVLFVGQAAMACGDSLYRVGKGTPYRTYTTPLPGQLLIYADNDNARELAQGLADSGHDVMVAVTTEALTEALQQGDFDVVLAPFTHNETVAASRRSRTEYLPVVNDRAERKQASEAYEHVLESDDNIKRYLKTIHKTLKSRA